MARGIRNNHGVAAAATPAAAPAGRWGRGVVVDSQVLETDRTASRAGALIFSTALFVVLFLEQWK